MSAPARHGWFKLPGQRGDRAVEEQLRGLAFALDQAKGRTVLDLGCAEGAIALEFARAGADRVEGFEIIAEHVEVARHLCAVVDAGERCTFRCVDLNKAVVSATHDGWDIVLALAVLHKLEDPAAVLRSFGNLARELVVIRMPGFARGRPPTVFRSERYEKDVVDVAQILRGCGFVLERVERGPHLERGPEPVLYFRRKSQRGDR